MNVEELIEELKRYSGYINVFISLDNDGNNFKTFSHIAGANVIDDANMLDVEIEMNTKKDFDCIVLFPA